MADVIQASYLAAALLFVLGLRGMSSPRHARRGIIIAGAGMLVATVFTFFTKDMTNYALMLIAIAVGGALAWAAARRVQMTAMPQMVAIYNGMGGGAAAAIAADELLRTYLTGSSAPSSSAAILAVLGALIGAVSFSGSMIAFAKLQDLVKRSLLFTGQNVLNSLVLLGALATGVLVVLEQLGVAATGGTLMLVAFFVLAILYGVLMTLPIGGADMPVVISMYNAFTGLAVGFEGYVLHNAALIIAGTVVGAAGTLLTQLMARAMNRSLANVLFAGFGAHAGQTIEGEVAGSLKPVDADDAAVTMLYSNRVIIVPGYGMAVAQAQHKVWELAQALEQRGVEVKFAIHPVAGRMPGHMNVLLAEAGVPYDKIFDLEEINGEFPNTDSALVIGANDVVNPAARDEPSSPIYGMPILDVDKARNVFVIKRGRGAGFAGIENRLFYEDQTRMLYGDGQEMAAKLVQGVKKV
jgi:H+-translocating NAD(P) transhydrogenase subunit beta